MSAAHVPTQDLCSQVEALAGVGVPYEAIAAYIGIAPMTLTKHYKENLQLGKARAFEKIGRTLFQKALDGDNTCLIFYAKTQMGWNEKIEVSGEIDLIPRIEKTITTIDAVNIIEHESESASQADTGAVLARD